MTKTAPALAPLAWALIVSCVLIPASGLAQIEEVEEELEELEDAGPASYVLPFIEEVHKESYGDFRKYVRERKWSRAFRSIGKQLDTPPIGLMPGTGPVFQTWQDQMRDDLSALPPAGRRAFRLYYDPKAKKALRLANEAPEADRPMLWRRIASSYFITSSGDDAACLLAGYAMKRNRPREAAELLRAVIDHHPDTDRDRMIVWLDYARALAAARNVDGFRDAADYIRGRYAASTVTDGGKDRKIEAVLDDLAKVASSGIVAESRKVTKLHLQGRSPTWEANLEKIKRGAGRLKDIFSGRTTRNVQPGSHKVPAAVIIGDNLWMNNDGQVISVDLKTGKRDWKRGSPGQGNNWQPLPEPIIVPLPNGRVLVSGTPTQSGRRHQSGFTMALECWDTKTKARLWRSKGRDDTKEFGFLGDALIDGQSILCAATKGGSRQLYLVSLAMDDGALQWEVDLGTPAGRSTSMGWGGATVPDLPVVVPDGSWIYVMGDGGAVVAVDRDAKSIGWAMRHDITGGRGSMYGNQVQPSCGSVRFVNGVLYFRAASSKYLYALDVRRRKVLWQRPVETESPPAIVGIDDELIYLSGHKLAAHSIKGGALRWSLSSDCNTRRPKIIIGDETIYVLTRGGIYERAKSHGGKRGGLAHKGLGTTGGHLLMYGDSLISVAGDRVCRIEVGETPPAPEPEEEAPSKSTTDKNEKDAPARAAGGQ